eukprot:1350995-Pyramimonas_sp.AAC.1
MPLSSCGGYFGSRRPRSSRGDAPVQAKLLVRDAGKERLRYTRWGPAGRAYYYTKRLHTYGALEGTPAFNDKLAKRIALQNMKEVVYDLDSFGIPVYISGDSLLVVSWLQGVWR